MIYWDCVLKGLALLLQFQCSDSCLGEPHWYHISTVIFKVNFLCSYAEKVLKIIRQIYRRNIHWKNYSYQPSISSTFYTFAFHTKFWHQKLQNCVLGLRFVGAKILFEKCSRKTLMKLTPYHKEILSQFSRNCLLAGELFIWRKKWC